MKNILVPCDFSRPAINAFRFALHLATQSRAIVHLLHAAELPVVMDPITYTPLIFEGPYREALEIDSIKQFERLKQDYLTESRGIEIISSLNFGPTANTLLNYVSTANIDLIVMGSHGVSGLREIVMGSNAEKIVRRSSVPVLVIKYHFTSVIKDIVFPNSFGKENQEGLVKKVKELQDFFQARLHLLHVNTPSNFIADEVMFSRLTDFASHFSLTNYTMNVYNHLNVEEGIHQFTRKINAGLIAIGTHGYTGIVHLVNGSLAENITNHSESLIWTYSLKNELVKSEA